MKVCQGCGRYFEPKHGGERYCKNPCTYGVTSGSSRSDRPGGYQRVLEREFVAWDGEGTQDPNDDIPRLVLLQGSNGASIHNEYGLSTEQCLSFLTEQPSACTKGNQRYNNVWFSNGYDVNMILGDLDWDRIKELYEYNSTHYEHFYIRYIPRYEFLVQNKETGKVFDSCDTWGFFQCPFETMLDDWEISPHLRGIISEGKHARGGFHRWSVDELKRYNEAELEALIEALEKLRSAILSSGWSLTRWYGPSSLATWFLQKHGIKEHIAQAPDPHVQEAALTAYFGGRIDAAGWGRWEGAHHYDLINAYVHGITKCPSLAGVQWTDKPSDDPYSLRRIYWKLKAGFWWGPFPWRVPYPKHKGQILYPREGEGWYWNVEIQAAQEMFGDYLQIQTLECLTPKHLDFYPLDEPLREAFAYRYELKRRGDPANKPIKLGYLAISGKFSQSVGYGNKRPAYQCHLWGGYLMAVTRANLLRASGKSNTLMTMTDGMFCQDPIESHWLGDGLGEWEDQGRGDLKVIAAGVYSFADELRCKGYLRESLPSMDEMIDRFEAGEEKIEVRARQFIGMGAALMGGKRQEDWRRFVNEPKQIRNPELYGSSKRYGKKGVNRGIIEASGRRFFSTVEGWHYQAQRGINKLHDMFMSMSYKPKEVVTSPQVKLEERLEDDN